MSKEWSRSTRYFVFTLVLAACLWFLLAARELLAPLAISALLAYVLNPAVTFVNKRAKLGRNWIVPLVYLLSIAALVVIGIVVIPDVTEQTASFLDELQIIITEIENEYLTRSIIILDTEVELGSLLPNPERLTSDFVRPDLIVEILQTTTTNVGWVLVVLVTTYYLLQDWARLREWLFAWTPDSYEEDSRRLYDEIKHVWNQYFKGQLRLSIIVGFLTGISCLIIGLPGALTFGILAAVFDVLLSVGPILVTIVAVIVALFAGSNVFAISNNLFALIVMSVFGGIHALENIWLRPRVMGRGLHIHPAIVFIAIVASLALAGVVTALIIIPVIGSVAVIARYIYFKLFQVAPWPEDEQADEDASATTSS